MKMVQRYRGCLLGLAVGDAVGTSLEFKKPGSFSPITGLVGGGPFRLKPGQWTDDTSMALCLAESLIGTIGFDAADQMKRYVQWWKEGHLSCTGECFDIGSATRTALSRFQQTGNPLSGSTDPYTAGNGSIMRLAPVPMLYANSPKQAIEFAAESSWTTHGAATAVDACRYFAALLVGALLGLTKEELLSDCFSPVKGYWDTCPLVSEIQEVASGSFRRKDPPEIKGTGYVVQSLEAALWAFHKSRDFREGCLLAANLGDDADTTAAVYGQLAGAFYGEPGIPMEWLEKLAMREQIASFAEQLFALSQSKGDMPDALTSEVQRAAEENLQAPFDRSYWIVPRQLLAGAYPGDLDPGMAEAKLGSLVGAGIRCFIDLTSPGDRNMFGQPLSSYEILLGKMTAGQSRAMYRRLAVTDLDVPTHSEMVDILDIIDGAILKGLPVYVHCLGGIGRAGTVIGCWLVRHGIAQGKDAIGLIKKLRRNEAHARLASPETAQQRRLVIEWEPGE